jgi:Mg/Co/Ni transporter MgtE
MLAMPQMRPVKSEVDPKDPSCRIVTYEGASSPRELLEVCVIQAKAALKSLNETRPAGLCEGDMKERLRQEALQRTKEEQEEAIKAEAEWDEINAEDDQLKAFWYFLFLGLERR